MQAVVAIVVGLALGAWWEGPSGGVVGMLIGWLVARSVAQQRELGALRRALAQLDAAKLDAAQRARPADAPASGSALPSAVRSAAERAPNDAVTAAPPLPADATGRSLAASDASVTPVPPPPLPPLPTPPPLPLAPAATTANDPRADADRWLSTARRWLFGGNTIVKAGVAILFIGLAFLVKFATENAHLPVAFRLAGIGVAALALLGLGWRLRRTRPGYAQVLQGGAVAVLYLLIFASMRLYGLLPPGGAFGLMLGVTGLAAALALLQDARSLAVVGALGGFATPFLVSTGTGSAVALFAYYLVLDLGIAAIAWFRTWRSLNLIGFVFTFGVAGAFGVLHYRPEQYLPAQAFLIAFFLLFAAIMLMPARQGPVRAHRSDGWVQGSLLFGLPTATFALQYGLLRDTDFGVAIAALVLAGFYVGLATRLRSRPGLALPFEGTLAVGTVLLTLVIPFALDARSTAGAWSLEGAGLVWLGFRQARPVSRCFGYVLLLLAGGAMAFGIPASGWPDSVFNAYLFDALMATAAALAAGLFVSRHAANSRWPHEKIAEPLLIGWATLWLAGAAVFEIDRFVRWPFRIAAGLTVVGAVALLYTGLARRLRWPGIGVPVAAHAPALALFALVSMLALPRPAAGGGWWAWPLAFAVHAVALRFAAPHWSMGPRRSTHALGLLVLAFLGALQGGAITAGWGDAGRPGDAWFWLGWLAVPALLLIALTRSGAAARWPVREAPTTYRCLAAAVLAAALVLWTLLANVFCDGAAAPLPYLPLLNPLDVGVAVALLAAWHWTRTDAARPLVDRAPAAPMAALALAGFVWLNAMLVRSFHHLAGVPYEFDAWTNSLAVQTGISLLWSVTALTLMWLAARRGARLPWTIGAGLLAAVVAKLLLVDLSGSGTVARIVSFIGVGMLMLVIGYVAPLPSKKTVPPIPEEDVQVPN